MNSEHLSHRQLKIPEASPEPLAQLLARAQQGLGSAPALDTVRWLHDSLAFLTEFFAAFSIGALKTVGPYSNSLEQLLKTPPSLDRAERLLAQAFIDWRSHPHHPAYESLRGAFFLTSRLQSSRTAPRRHTRWLGVEGRAVEGLEQLSRWSRRLDLLVGGGDDAAAQEQIRLYLPLLWIWTDALDGFFRDWSLQLKSDIEDGKLKITGTANRDDIHLQLLSSHPIAALKANFHTAPGGSIVLDGFSAPLNGVAPSAIAEVPADPVLPSVTEPDISLVLDGASGTYVMAGAGDPEIAAVPERPHADLPAEDLEPIVPQAELVEPEPELPGPDDLPDLEPTLASVETEPTPVSIPAGSESEVSPGLGAFSLDLSLPEDVAPVPVAAPVEPELFALPPTAAPEPVEPELFALPPTAAPEPEAAPVEPELFALPPTPAPAPEPVEPELFALPPTPASEPEAAPVEPELFALPPTAAPEPEAAPVEPELFALPPTAAAEPEAAQVEPELFALPPTAAPEPETVPAEPELFALPPTAAPEPEPEPVEPELFALPPTADAAPVEPELFLLTPTPAPEPEPVAAEPEIPTPEPAAPLQPELFTLSPNVESENVVLEEPELLVLTPKPDFTASEPEAAGPALSFEPVTEPGVLASPGVEPDLFAGATPAPEPVGNSESDLLKVAPLSEPGLQQPDLFAAPESKPLAPEPDLFAVDSDSIDFGASSEPLFSTTRALDATMEVAPATPEPTVELQLPVEAPVQPSTPWADLIAASSQKTASEVKPEADQPEDDTPIPDFSSSAPSRAEMPDFSDDMSDFSAGFGGSLDFSSATGTPEGASDFASVVDPSAASAELPEFTDPTTLAAPDFSATPTSGLPDFSPEPTSAMPDFSAAPTPGPLDFGATPTPTPEPTDFSATPTPEPTDFSATPTPEPTDFSATPTPEPTDFSATPTPEPTDFSATPTLMPALPDFGTAPTSGLPDFGAAPTSGLPDFGAALTPALPDFGAAPTPALPDFSATPDLPQFSATPTPALPDFSAVPTSEPAIPVLSGFDPPEPVRLAAGVPGQSIEMGGQAEEILEDNFKFSLEAGPARPQWKGWGVSERETVQQVCESAVGAHVGKIPTAFASPVAQALRSDVKKFQIVLGPGCGKSHLAYDLCVMEPQGAFGPALLAEWPANHSGDVGGHELLSLYFQLREDVKSRGTQVILPEPETVATLASAVASDGFVSGFQRLLGQLAVLNRGGLTLLFDEPPEGIRQCLATELPGRLRVISFVTALNSGPELGARVELQAAWPQAALELYGPVVSEVSTDPAANLLRVGLYAQLRAVGGTRPGSLADIGPAVLNSSAVDPDLLACLALEQKPVSLDDLDQWYLSSEKVATCIRAFPSLFCLRSTRLSPQLGLSHHSVESAILQGLSEPYQKAAVKLVGWVISQLERTNSDKYGGLQVREIVSRNFCRLYRYAGLTRSLEILEWVVRNKDLQRNRVALTTHLEKPANRWELQKLLLLLTESLSTLVAGGKADLRDEKAWALSHLGLNQLHLGLSQEALTDITSAVELFITLVDNEKQHEFRPALATTLYRASKIADSLDRAQEARDYAERAVSDLVELVEDRGRADLQSRLGIAMALRGGLKSDAADIAGAMKDLQRAASLLASSSEEKQRENKRSQIEVQLELSSIYLKAKDIDNAIKESGKAVQLATQAVEELQLEELQPLLASCHTTRARCFLLLNETDRAQRDVSKSITLRNLAVDEGRLDQRFELSKEYLLRSQIDRGRGMTDDAGRDLSRAIEVLEQLDGEGRRDAKRQLLVCLVERSELALASGDSVRSIEDLKKAFMVSQADASGEPEAVQARLSVLDGLLRAYLRAGESEQALAVSGELLTHYQANQDWENFARVQLVRGDALERQANLAASNESFTQAIGILSKLLEQGQTDDRLSMVAEAYLGSGSVELKLGNSDHASEQIKRSLDIFNHLFQQRGMKTALPKMLKAYSLFAAVNLNKNKTQDAMVLLKSGFDVLAYLEKEGGANVDGLDLRKAELYRQRARAFFQQGEASPALHDSEEAIRNFLLDRQKNQTGPWKDELARTWTLRSSIFFVLKDFSQAESSVQEAITHFEEQVRAGKFQYFEDLMKALGTRAENAGKAGKIDRVLEEYGRMLGFAAAAGQSGTAINVDLESARILEKRARVYRDQSLFNEAYGDYDRVIGLYRKLLSERGGTETAVELVRVHLERGEMISAAGHGEHAIGDYTQAIDLAKALVGQGQLDAAPSLARGLQKRADCYRSTGKAREALQDLEGAVGFQMQMAQQRQDPELMGSLARALLSQGSLLAGFQQVPQAAASLDKAIGIFTQLVEQQQQRQYSSDMAQALIQRVSLSGDKTDPAMRQVLIRAVDLVTQQARDGKPVARDFPIDCLRAVVDLLTREDFDTVGDLIDAVLRLVELVVADGKSNQDFVKLTDLLLAASAGLIDDRRTARRPNFLALACVSCNREIQMFGKNSLPRLVYCLYELGQALERSKPPAVLNYIGSSFALLGELASQQQNNEDFTRELKMMVTTWRSLPPQVPALANVSRHMLSQLLRLT